MYTVYVKVKAAKLVLVLLFYFEVVLLLLFYVVIVIKNASKEVDDSHNLPLESSTRLQLGLGAAMSGVELLAANRLRAWGFQQLAKIFEDVRVGTVTARLVVAALTSCVAHRWMSFCHPPWAPQPPR